MTTDDQYKDIRFLIRIEETKYLKEMIKNGKYEVNGNFNELSCTKKFSKNYFRM
jgi:hypothetical protein